MADCADLGNVLNNSMFRMDKHFKDLANRSCVIQNAGRSLYAVASGGRVSQDGIIRPDARCV